MKKISVSLSGHQTSITLEPEFIDTLKQIATARGVSVASLVCDIDNTRTPDTNLSSAIRVWILNQVMKH
jgi:predicted DNA-binding ribbon-helix-helix protein